MVHVSFVLSLLPLLNSEAHAGHSLTFTEYILQSNVINVSLVAIGLGFILSKLNIPKKLDESTQKLIQPLQDAQAFRNKTESDLTSLTLKFQTLDQAKSQIITTAEETAHSIKLQLTDKIQQVVHGLTVTYESKKQRESALLQSAILNEVVDQLFDDVESTLPALKVCHETLVQLLITELKVAGNTEIKLPLLESVTS
jgi:hypothetical protein